MEKKLKKILNHDLNITHGIYEPPNNIPILRYKINREGYKLIVIGNSLQRLSCISWLATELLKPEYVFETLDELDIIDKSNKYFVVIADENYKYSAYQSKLLSKLADLGIQDYICPYDYEKIPRHDINYLDYFAKNHDNLLAMLNCLHDSESKETYVEYIRSKMYCDFYRLTQHPTWNKYFDENVYTHLPNEVFINCGASNGDTIFYFMEKFKDFQKIIALESDKERIKQFKENLGYFRDDIQKRISLIEKQVDGNNNRLDLLCSRENVSLINMDIEGAELETLQGAKELIRNNLPVIAACAYHLPTDLFELPMHLKNISEEYEIFYRKYASTVRNRFCNAELVMYAVPKRRLVK